MKTLSIMIVLAALIASCTMGPLELAGGSTNTTNGKVVGSIRTLKGTPASGTIVRLLPATYDPVADYATFSKVVAIDSTDANGAYSFSRVRPGDYIIEAVQDTDRTRLLIDSIKVDTTTFLAPTRGLQKPGAVTLELSAFMKTPLGYVYIPGTTISTLLSDVGSTVTLDSLPAGKLPSINFGVVNSPVRRVVRYDMRVIAGSTETIFNPDWNRSKTLYLNTSASGAGIMGNITGFPVLVRLHAPDFAFVQTRANGDDILFAKTDGTLLPYEIEQWDATAGQAALWVRVDTIYGNNGTQAITMLWGNPDAGTVSSGANVFDTANGFEGVWHLGEAESTPAYDATANGYNGAGSSTRPLTGIAGLAQQFNGSSSFIQMTGTAGSTLNYPENGSYCVSAWAYVDTMNHAFTHQIIASKGDHEYSLEVMDSTAAESSGRPGWEFSETQDMAGWDITVAPMTTRTWVYLSGIRSGDRQYLYVNGVCVDSTIKNLRPILVPRDLTQDLFIGKMSNGTLHYFSGAIDEVRISSGVPSADWIKLCYMNQKAADALIQF